MLNSYTICTYGVNPIGLDQNKSITNYRLISGSDYLTDEQRNECKEKKYILDNTGDNISHLNYYFAELTSIYWIWKNCKEEFVYSRQYRRKLDINPLISKSLNIDENTFYTSPYIPINPRFRTMKEQVGIIHGHFNYYNYLHEIALDSKIKLTSEMIDETFVNDRSVSIVLSLAHKDVYNKYMEVLFEIIFEIWDRYGDYCIEICNNPSLDPDKSRRVYDKRYMSYIAERIQPILYKNWEYFFGKKLKVTQLKQCDYNVDINSIKTNYEKILNKII